jgi:UDP-glucose 4-epimerase
MNLYVPMETLRDYLYVDDAARMIRGLLDTWSPRQPDRPVIRNLASERPVPVAAVLRTVERIARRNILVGLGSNPASRYQVRDLRVITAHPREYTKPPITSLPIGVKLVYEHTLADVKHARYRLAG